MCNHSRTIASVTKWAIEEMLCTLCFNSGNVPFGHWFHCCNQIFWSQSAVYDPLSSSVEFVLKCGVLLILVACQSRFDYNLLHKGGEWMMMHLKIS